MFIDAAVGEQRPQWVDQAGIPTGMHHPESPGIDEQRHFVKPLQEVVPVGRMVLELGQGFMQQSRVARGVFAHELLAAARQRRRAPAQGVELVITHDAQRLAGFDHVMDNMQGLANARAAVDDIAHEHRHARRVPPDATLLLITEPVEQVLKGQSATVHVTDQVVATRGIKHQSPPPPSRLPQPSLVRQTS